MSRMLHVYKLLYSIFHSSVFSSVDPLRLLTEEQNIHVGQRSKVVIAYYQRRLIAF